MEGRKGLSENLYDTCDLLLIAGTAVPACAKQRLDAVLGNVWIRKRAFPSLSRQR